MWRVTEVVVALDVGGTKLLGGLVTADGAVVVRRQVPTPRDPTGCDPGPAAVESAVACPLPPGGATVHTSRTMHDAGPNRTDEPRRALIMAFACEAVPLDVPREFPWQRPEWSA